jgi:ABC-2 type transport system ATP-binding protein
MNKQAVAQFTNVVKWYRGGLLRRDVHALDDVTWRVPRGEITGLVGPNRAGKSTLVKLLLTLCRPTSGQITRLGRSWHDRGTLAQVGYIHESQSLPRYLTAWGLLEYYGALSGLKRHTIRRRATKLLERVGLDDRGREPIARFSKGMVQRLALAQALLNEPELLVFDEPTEGMDLLARRMVHEALVEQRRLGRSVLLVSHALADIETLCDRVAVLREGRLVFFGRPEELTSGQDESFEAALAPWFGSEEKSGCLACVSC